MRHGITFLVTSGFSLTEVRQLYLDEFIEYTNSLIYIKERKGELTKGTYNKLKKQDGNTVGNLRAQLFKIKPHGK